MKNKIKPIQKVWLSIVISALFYAGCNKDDSGNFPSSIDPIQRLVVIMIDGVRWEESWGDNTYQNIPYRSQLKQQGILFTNFSNNGVTFTTPGHTALMTGVYENINNSGLQLPNYAGLFQLYLKRSGKPNTDAWIVSSKDKLEVLADCYDTEFAGQYNPLTDCGVNGLGSGSRDDTVTLQRAIDVLDTHHPHMLMVHFKNPDFTAHTGVYADYIAEVKKTDSLCNVLCQKLLNDPVYKDHTLILISNDHGRHTDGIADGFVSHGDSCIGCRHIELLALGSYASLNNTDNNRPYELIDVYSTIVKRFKLDGDKSRGKRINELLWPY